MVPKPHVPYISAEMHPMQAQSFGLCRILGRFCQIGPHTQLLTCYRPNYLPAKTSNQLPTRHPKPHYLASLVFRNPQLVVNPSLGAVAEHGVDGRGRDRDRKSDLDVFVSERQI